MCKFCSQKIMTKSEFDEMRDRDYITGTFLLKYPDGEIVIYDAIEDSYYNNATVCNVKYCPCCGEKLK